MLVIVLIVGVSRSLANGSSGTSDTPKTDDTIQSTPTAHVHSYSEDWTTTEDYHWHKSTCEHDLTKDRAMHDFDQGETESAATEEQHGVIKFTCNTCGYVKKETAHNFELSATDVVLSTGDKLFEARCTVCGLQNPTLNKVEHTFSEDWETDETSHWHKATCQHDVTTEKQTHTFVEGVCSVCNYPQPVTPLSVIAYRFNLGRIW